MRKAFNLYVTRRPHEKNARSGEAGWTRRAVPTPSAAWAAGQEEEDAPCGRCSRSAASSWRNSVRSAACRGRGPHSRLPRQSQALASQWPQEREILSGGMKPVSPRALSATRPSGLTTRCVMLPLLRERRSQPSGGNCSALVGRGQCDHGGPDSRRPKASGCFVELGPPLGRQPPTPPCHFQAQGLSGRRQPSSGMRGSGDAPVGQGRHDDDLPTRRTRWLPTGAQSPLA